MLNTVVQDLDACCYDPEIEECNGTVPSIAFSAQVEHKNLDLK